MFKDSRKLLLVCSLAALAVVVPASLEAQEVAGIRVDLNSISGNTVNFDVVEFTDGGGNSPTVPLQVIEYGDGSTVTSPVVTRTASSYAGHPAITGVYRGTFSHVYPGPGSYNLRAGDCCAGWPISNTAYYITGYYLGTSDTSVTIWNNLAVDLAPPVSEVPTLSRTAIACLAIALMALGAWLLRRKATA